MMFSDNTKEKVILVYKNQNQWTGGFWTEERKGTILHYFVLCTQKSENNCFKRKKKKNKYHKYGLPGL